MGKTRVFLVAERFRHRRLGFAAAAIYGVISYAVSRRTHEIGIRMALGAMPDQVLRSILASGMTLVVAGVAAGLAATLFAARLLETLLFGVSSRDALIYSRSDACATH